jgi:hypothetical protein
LNWSVYKASVSSTRFEQLQARNSRQPCSLPAARTRPLRPRNHFSRHSALDVFVSHNSTKSSPLIPAVYPEINTRTLLSPRISLRKILLIFLRVYVLVSFIPSLVHMHCEQCVEEFLLTAVGAAGLQMPPCFACVHRARPRRARTVLNSTYKCSRK